MKIAIVLDIEGNNVDAYDVIDSVLDDGTLQDALAERARDKGIAMRVVSVVSEPVSAR